MTRLVFFGGASLAVYIGLSNGRLAQLKFELGAGQEY
jgi:hypothetical protein